MSLHDDRMPPLLQRASSLFLLNLLWVLASLPIITLLPATAAMFGVVRQWVRGQEEELFASFIRLFKENALQSLLIGLFWLAVAALLGVNVLLAGQVEPPLRLLVLVITGTVSFFYLLATPYLFPSIVHFRAGAAVIARNTVFLSLSAPHLSLLGLGALGVAGFVAYSAPITLLFGLGAMTAYLLYLVFHRAAP